MRRSQFLSNCVLLRLVLGRGDLRPSDPGYSSNPGIAGTATTGIRKIVVLLVVSLALTSVQSSQAATACPVLLYGGKRTQGTIRVSFMNRGKVPIRQLGLDCTVVQNHKTERSACHSESGVFFPGTPYTLHFSDPSKISQSIQVSVKNAVLDGYIWTPAQDQPCRSLRIYKR